MKRIRFPIYSVIAFLIVLLLSVFVFVADLLRDKGIYFYTGVPDFTTGDLFITIFLIGGGFFVSAVAVLLHKNSNRRLLKIIGTLLAALVSLAALLSVFTTTALFMPHSYVELVSDDGAHHIVIGEDCYFFSPYGGDVFEKTSFCTMKKLKKYVAEKDFYTPFSDGDYSVTWNDEDFELFYDSDGDGEKDEKLLVKYLP